MKRSNVALVAFVIVAFAVGALRSLREARTAEGFDPRPTSTNAQPAGLRALALWLREFGYPAASWRRPLTELDDDHAALVLVAPTQALTAEQVDSLFAWVERGHVLVVSPGADEELEKRLEQSVELVLDPTEASQVRGDRIVPHEGMRWRYRESTPDERGQFAYPVREVATLTRDRVRDVTSQNSVLFAREEQEGLVAEIWHGDGAILLFADADMLTNRGLDRANNVGLVASLLDDWVPRGSTIAFDDWSHGLRPGGSLMAYVLHRRPGLLAVATACVAFLAVLRYGRSLVRERERRAKRRDPTEFVEALGGLYARSHATGPAWSATSRVARRYLDGTWPAPRLPAEERERRAKKIQTALAIGERRKAAAGEEELLALTRTLTAALAPRDTGRSAERRRGET
ncbi:MAG: DUF4350 domain-containing protein [bacterium]